MTLNIETIKRLAVEASHSPEKALPCSPDRYVFTEPQLLVFANSIAALITELNQIDDVFSVSDKDAERINWLEKEHRKHGEISFKRYGIAWTKLFTISTQHMKQKPTIRDAIDAAMKESESKE